MMNLTNEQKQLLCDLIDGYAYPRFLCQCDPLVDTEGIWDGDVCKCGEEE